MIKCALGLVVMVSALLSVSCSNTPTLGPGATYTISGQITDLISAAAIAAVAVAIQGKTATTNAAGQYSIADLTAGQTTLTAQRQGHVNYSQNLTVSASANVSFAMTRDRVATAAGNWVGQWSNATFGSSGSMTMTVTTDTIAQTATIVLDLNGNVFGGGDPAPETFPASYSPTTGANLTRTSAVYGTAQLTVSSTGQVTGSLTNVPGGTISRVDITGTATETTITINYTVTFVGGATAIGTASLSRVV